MRASQKGNLSSSRNSQLTTHSPSYHPSTTQLEIEDARKEQEAKEQLRRESKKALDSTCGLIMVGDYDGTEKTKKLRDLVKRMERALGEENVVTLETLNNLGNRL